MLSDSDRTVTVAAGVRRMPTTSRDTAPSRERAFSIGQVARLLSVSAQTLRYYEQEGLIIPLRSAAGTRRYEVEDVRRLHTIRKLITEESFSIATIQRLLAMVPCWELMRCNREDCPQRQIDDRPCWMNRTLCQRAGRGCRRCPAYRLAFDAISERRVLRLSAARRSGW